MAQIADMQQEINRLQEEIERGRARYEAAIEGGAWMPLPDGEYTMPLWDGDTYTLHVTDNGETLEAWPDADKHKFKDGSPKQVEEIGLNDYRLCMRTTASAPVASEPVPRLELVPDGPLDTLGTILRNRTIFIPCSMRAGILHGYTLANDEYLVRQRAQDGEGTP